MKISKNICSKLVLHLCPPIRVHSWGGFGSQLFALVALHKLERKYPYRKLKLVFHTGGVTYRNIEVRNEMIPYRFTVVDDFRTKEFEYARVAKVERVKKAGRPTIKILLKKLGILLGVISNMNDEVDFKDTKIGVVDVRGHYSKLEISREIATYFLSMMSRGFSGPDTKSDSGTVHWRMGDLLELNDKGPIPASRIGSIMRFNDHIRNWTIFSDTGSNEAIIQLSSIPPDSTWNNPSSPEETIVANLYSSIFIGTNSKISFWIAVFRSLANPTGITYLPEEIEKSFSFPSFTSPEFY